MANIERGPMQAGEVVCKSMSLYSPSKNKSVDLSDKFVDFTFYENLFTPSIAGYVAVVESQNLIAMLPILGEELLLVEFATPGYKQTIKRTFYVTGVGMRVHGDKKNAYTLEFISHAAHSDLNQPRSKSYAGHPTELASTIYKDAFGTNLLSADEAINQLKFVSPWWGPLKCINFISNRAFLPDNKLQVPNFVFYETNRGHKFKSLSTLMKQKPIRDLVFDKNTLREYLPDKTSTRNVDKEYKSILSLEFNSSQNYIMNHLNGVFRHVVYSFDLYSKKFNTKQYDFKNDFYKSQHLSDNAFQSSTMTIGENARRVSVLTTGSNVFTGIGDRSDEMQAKRLSLIAQLDVFKLNIKIHGTTNIEVGDTVNLTMNMFQSIDHEQMNKDTFDKLYSGRYLITAIEQRFTKIRHEMNMQIVKDSTFTSIERI